MGTHASPLEGRVAFLVGVRRSGTNWLRRIVDAHPDATVIPGETYLFSHGIAPLVERVQHGIAGSARTGFAFVDRSDFLCDVRSLCDRILAGHLHASDIPGYLVAERTPDHVRHLELIGDVYPDAAVVHIIRDGRDVARSLVSQPWGPADHAEAAEEWVSGIGAARAAAPRLSRYLEVRYEQMLADPASHVPALYRFLGLDDTDDVVRRALAEADVPYNVDPESGTVREGKWRQGLDPGDLARVLRVAGPLLTELGYDDGAPGAVSPPTTRVRPVLRSANRAVSVARRLAGRDDASDDAVLQRRLLDGFDSSMIVLDDLFGRIAAGRSQEIHDLFAPRARIRWVDGPGSWDERGPAAVDRLAGALAGDPAAAGRQLRGDVHPSHPSFTVVATWERGGRAHDRVVVVTRFGDRISELAWYVLPRISQSGDDGSDPV
jgi:hypothetical protein